MGFIVAMLFSCFVIHPIFVTKDINSFAFGNFAILTAIILILAQIGDLGESWIKRQCDVKDSGNWIPGHGGILDRMDSFTVSAPFVYITLLLNNGVIF